MSKNLKIDEECELKEAKIQMREESVDSEIDEPDAAQECQLEYRERIAVIEKLLN